MYINNIILYLYVIIYIQFVSAYEKGLILSKLYKEIQDQFGLVSSAHLTGCYRKNQPENEEFELSNMVNPMACINKEKGTLKAGPCYILSNGKEIT